jgi:hypothetical protein
MSRAKKREMTPEELGKACEMAVQDIGEYFLRNPGKATDGSVRASLQVSREIDEYKARVAREKNSRKAKAEVGGK